MFNRYFSMWLAFGGMLLLATVLAGCEGAVTGKEIARVPLQPAEDGPAGAYAPVKFTLHPEMSPVAFNFRADFTQNATEAGKWNSYRATLTNNGSVITSRTFNVNHPASSPDNAPPAPASLVHTLFYVDVKSGGEYVLTLVPVSPPAVTLANPQADARRNVQRPPSSQ